MVCAIQNLIVRNTSISVLLWLYKFNIYVMFLLFVLLLFYSSKNCLSFWFLFWYLHCFTDCDLMNMSGTSFAAPIVAAVAAVVWGKKPSLTYREVKQIILDTGRRYRTLKSKKQNSYYIKNSSEVRKLLFCFTQGFALRVQRWILKLL